IPPSMHTLYWGAHRFAEPFHALEDEARAFFAEHAPDPERLAALFAIEEALAERVHASVAAKLGARPIEDVRIDFEDGYGLRPDAEEDRAATETARAAAALPDEVGVGIRIKSLTPEVARRGMATLERFVSELADARGSLPPRFVICVPKVTTGAQAAIAAELLDGIERAA